MTFEYCKCGMPSDKDNDNIFAKSCRYRFLGDCWKRLPCKYKLKQKG